MPTTTLSAYMNELQKLSSTTLELGALTQRLKKIHLELSRIENTARGSALLQRLDEFIHTESQSPSKEQAKKDAPSILVASMIKIEQAERILRNCRKITELELLKNKIQANATNTDGESLPEYFNEAIASIETLTEHFTRTGVHLNLEAEHNEYLLLQASVNQILYFKLRNHTVASQLIFAAYLESLGHLIIENNGRLARELESVSKNGGAETLTEEQKDDLTTQVIRELSSYNAETIFGLFFKANQKVQSTLTHSRLASNLITIGAVAAGVTTSYLVTKLGLMCSTVPLLPRSPDMAQELLITLFNTTFALAAGALSGVVATVGTSYAMRDTFSLDILNTPQGIVGITTTLDPIISLAYNDFHAMDFSIFAGVVGLAAGITVSNWTKELGHSLARYLNIDLPAQEIKAIKEEALPLLTQMENVLKPLMEELHFSKCKLNEYKIQQSYSHLFFGLKCQTAEEKEIEVEQNNLLRR